MTILGDALMTTTAMKIIIPIISKEAEDRLK